MSGAPLWDAAVWVVLGAIGGWAITRWTSFRAALVFAVLVSLLGVAVALGFALLRGEAGLGVALIALFWSVPCSLGLALGGLVTFARRGPR
ncbi:MAG: hypothetical protein Kow0013_05420 [Pararhodobacter sp.]